VGSGVVIAGCDGKVRCISVKTGRQTASATVDANFGAPPAALGGTVLVGSLSGVYLRMRLSDGHLLWQVREKEDGAACYAGAAIQGDTAIFASRSCRVFRVDARNGRPVWTYRTKGQVNSSPVISGSTVYVGSDEGNLYALDLASGRLKWRFAAGAEIKGSPAIGSSRLVIGSGDGAVYCFTAARGR